MGAGSQVVFPVSMTERGVSSGTYGTVIDAVKAVAYSLSFWSHHEIVAARTLQVGSLVNRAGQVVHPSKATVVSAMSDFHADETDLLLGIFAHTSVSCFEECFI